MPLIVVPTPVGNMEDITLRALRVLRAADLIACEDTRRTRKILSRYSIRTRLVSYHSFNEKERSVKLAEMLSRGETVALVSDAGTPGISDPGYELIRRSFEEGYEVDVLPGATALVPALVMSGFPTQPFLFEGFLPKRRGDRRKRIEILKEFNGAVIIYLSPHGGNRVLADLMEILGDRPSALLREISKIHQERIPGTLSSIIEAFDQGPPRGEMVLVLGPTRGAKGEVSEGWEGEALRMAARGLPDKEVVKRVTEEYGIPKNTVKRFLLGRIQEKEAL